MKVVITLFNEENGTVKIDCNPPLQKLIDIWRSGDRDPALAYAIAGIEKMIQFSKEIEAEQQREARNHELMNRTILFDPRLKKQPLTGPQEIN